MYSDLSRGLPLCIPMLELLQGLLEWNAAHSVLSRHKSVPNEYSLELDEKIMLYLIQSWSDLQTLAQEAAQLRDVLVGYKDHAKALALPVLVSRAHQCEPSIDEIVLQGSPYSCVLVCPYIRNPLDVVSVSIVHSKAFDHRNAVRV